MKESQLFGQDQANLNAGRKATDELAKKEAEKQNRGRKSKINELQAVVSEKQEAASKKYRGDKHRLFDTKKQSLGRPEDHPTLEAKFKALDLLEERRQREEVEGGGKEKREISELHKAGPVVYTDVLHAEALEMNKQKDEGAVNELRKKIMLSAEEDAAKKEAQKGPVTRLVNKMRGRGETGMGVLQEEALIEDKEREAKKWGLEHS